MTERTNPNNYLKCPHCNCIFFSQADLQAHLAAYGENRGQHEYLYSKTHGRLEHGYSDE